MRGTSAHTGAGAERTYMVNKGVVYVPVLKSKRGEHWAWRHVGPTVASMCRPVFQVISQKEVACALQDFVVQVTSGWPAGSVLTVDTGFLDQTQLIRSTRDRAVLWTSRRLLEEGIPAKAVMRLSDEAQVLAEVSQAATLHGEGACLRLGSDNQYPDPNQAQHSWPRICRETGFQSIDIDLLLDFRSVDCQQAVIDAIPLACSILLWASLNGPWRSVTLLSGAAPLSIADLPVGRSTPCRRHDVDLFIGTLNSNPALRPDFGDYGIWHPAFFGPPGFAPRPNLRYTYRNNWHVYREETPNARFFAIARSVVASPHWPAAGGQYSAGDGEILRCSTATSRPGGATQWLQWGGSHHFAHVVDRLTAVGVP